MLKFITNLVFFFGKLISYIFPYRLIKKVITLNSYFYSGWISRTFNIANSGLFVQGDINIEGGQYISVGKNFQVLKRLRIAAIDFHNRTKYQPEIIIGNNVIMNNDCNIACINKIVIGNNVLIASRVLITDHYHGNSNINDIVISPESRELYSMGPIIIEDNVWIGEGVCILPNVIIGKNSIIGSNSVITKNIPENSIASGNPARIIRIID